MDISLKPGPVCNAIFWKWLLRSPRWRVGRWSEEPPTQASKQKAYSCTVLSTASQILGHWQHKLSPPGLSRIDLWDAACRATVRTAGAGMVGTHLGWMGCHHPFSQALHTCNDLYSHCREEHPAGPQADLSSAPRLIQLVKEPPPCAQAPLQGGKKVEQLFIWLETAPFAWIQPP